MASLERASALQGLIDVEALRAALRGSRGRGIRVAILDSGVDGRHPELAGRIAGQFDVVEGQGRIRCEAAPTADLIGHGTACAGIVAALAPEAEITSIRVFGAEARTSTEALAAALGFALDRGFDVINMSLGTTSAAGQMRLTALADRAFYEGRIVVAAANNFGHVAYPAHLSSVIAVGMEGFSEPERLRYLWDEPIEVGARGVYVEAPALGGGTQLFTGTSFACPHVSGIVARLVGAFPGLSAFEARLLLALLATPQPIQGEPA
jgi:subtilisin